MRPEEILDALDDDQRDVVSHLGSPTAILAGAGTGKTRTITHRIAYAASVGSINPYATLAVSFTTAAASELKNRLADMGVHGVQCRTFHSAALRQAQYFWPLVYGVDLPRVMDDPLPVIRQACGRLGVVADPSVVAALAGEISWTKQANVLPDMYADMAAAQNRFVPRLDFDQVAELIVAYEEAKQEACVIDLDDLLLCAVALLATDRHVATKVSATYCHFVVDEFQDVSPIQSRLVDLWLGAGHDICVVGDPAQTIHSFAGARSEYLEMFASRHQGTQSYQLTRNYRSTPEIIGAANSLNPGGLQLVATCPHGEKVTMVGEDNPHDERKGIAAWATKLHRQGMDWSKIAILFRTHAQADAMRSALAGAGVPFVGQAAEDRSARDAVNLGTLHASKGREFDAVAIGGVNEGSVPHPLACSPEQLAEEKRLLYVGMTRAKHCLRLSWSESVNNRIASRSRFIDAITSRVRF